MPEDRGACLGAPGLADFHAGRLVGKEARDVAEHIEACAICRAELAELTLDHRFTLELREFMPGGPGEPEPAASEENDPEHEALVALLRDTAAGERYELVGELGHGGMGVVYEVRDRVLQRNLAMKVARAEGRSASSAASPTGRRLARFLEEVRITGQLDHPSVIPVHELGIDAQGRAFFTMRNVRGSNLHEVLEEFERGEGDWTLQRLVGVVQRACEAVAYAHSKRVVHRDLKPSNVMVGRFSAVYVMDWGVAKIMDNEGGDSPDATDTSHLRRTRLGAVREGSGVESAPGSPAMTLDGEVLGTPAYMSPEQARGVIEVVDSRADVYSMGAILYRLLSGRTPYDDGAKGSTPHTAWKRLLEGPPAELDEIAPKAPPELIAVCQRAMTRDMEERYADMAALTADLRAWLEGRVVRAYKTGVVIELRKWVGRNRALASAGLLVLIALAVLPALLVQEARSSNRLERSELSLKALGLIEKEPAEALRAAIQALEAEPNYLSRTTLLAALTPLALDAKLYRAWPALSSVWCVEGSRRAWSPAGDAFVFGERPLEGGPVTIRVWNVKARSFEGPSFEGAATEVYAFHPDGRRVASGARDGSVAMHDLQSGESRTLRDEDGRAHTDVVSRLAFSPDGRLLASASWDGSVRLWDGTTGRLVRSLEGHTGVVSSIEFDADGERLLSASGPPTLEYKSDETARVWDVASGVCLRVFEGHVVPEGHDDPGSGVTSARFHPKGELALSTSYDRTAQLWRLRDGEVLDVMPFEGAAWDGAFSPDGSKLAVAFDSGLLVRNEGSGVKVRLDQYAAHEGRAVTNVEFSPDGERLLTTGIDGTGRVWEFDATGKPRLALRLPHAGGMTFGSWSTDGSVIATANASTTCLWFPGGNPTTDWERPAEKPATHARFHPAGDRVLVTLEDSPAYEYLFAPGEGLRDPPSKLGDAPARDAITTASGTWTLVAEAGGPVRLWRSDGGGASRKVRPLELDALSLQPSGAPDLVGVILAGGGAALIDCSGDPEVTASFAPGETVSAIRCSGDGRRVALGTAQGHLVVLDLEASGRVLVDEQLALKAPSQTAVLDLCFYNAGRSLISAGPHSGVRVWDVDAGRELEHIGPNYYPTIGGVFVLEDGRDLVTRAQWHGPVYRRNLASGRERSLSMLPSSGIVTKRTTGWSLDRAQQRLLATSLGGTATVWDLEHDEPWLTFTGHDAPVLCGDLSRDGQWAVTADATGIVFVWPTDPLEWAARTLPVDLVPKRD